MWRRHLTIGLLTVIVGIWIASWEAHTPYLSALQKYSGDLSEDYQGLVRDNLRVHLRQHDRLIVSPPDALQIAPLRDGLLERGKRFLVLFSAKPERDKQRAPDLYVMQVNMGANAYPLSFTPARNLTRNAQSEDRLFALRLAEKGEGDRGAQILFGQLEPGGRCRAVTYLWWSDEASEGEALSEQSSPLAQIGSPALGVSAWENAHYFDHPHEPEWATLRFDQPLPDCSARLGIAGESDRGDHKFQVLRARQVEFTVDTITEAVTPVKSGVELVSRHEGDSSALSGLQHLLKVYNLLNLDEDLNMSSLKSNVANSFERNVYELMADSAEIPPVGEVSSILDSRRPTWYPPRIDVQYPLPQEGVWRPVKVRSNQAPLILKTFVRLDPKHPYHSVHLYALDMRRLGLKFVAGADLKAQHLEGVGSSRIARDDQAQVIAAFNGGPRSHSLDGASGELSSHGIIENRHVLAPASEGLSTVAIDDRGRIALGLLDISEAPRDWPSLRQSYAPLVDLRVNDRDFVPPQSPKGRLDHLHLTRSALGINSQGTLVFAWSKSTTTQLLAQALKLVGVQFAMSLRATSEQSGLALYPDPRISAERPAYSKMPLDPKVWREGALEDFFYVVLAQSLPKSFPKRRGDWRVGEGEWAPVKHQDIDPWLSRSFVSAERAGSLVELLLIDGERLRVNLALGEHRKLKPTHEERPLVAAPVARIPIGIGTRTLGVTELSVAYHQAQAGKMTWGVDDQGNSVIDRWGQGDMSSDGAWRDILQGEAIIDRGAPIQPRRREPAEEQDQESARNAKRKPPAKPNVDEEPPPPVIELFESGPIAALGITANNNLVFAHVARPDLPALQSAMISAGVVRALRVNHIGTAQTGEAQFFYNHSGQTFYNVYPDLALKPAFLETGKSALLSLEDALIITARASNPRARFVESFQNLEAGQP